MESLRLWIVLLACTAFGAGVGAGWYGSNRLHEREAALADAGPFSGFQREFARTFDPSPERARLLAELLACYQREIDALEEVQLENARSRLEPQLESLALTYGDRIRNSVLLPEQRARYDELARGIDWKAKN